MRDTTFIYALRCPISREIRYIGKTDRPKERLQRHIWYSTKKQPAPKFHSACWIRSLAETGAKPVLEILREVPYDERKYWERRAIRVYRAVGFDLTNVTEGGDGAANGVRNPNYGKKFSPERCEQMRQRMLGHVPWNKGIKVPQTSGVNHHTFGKVFSEQTLARMSAAAKGRTPWNKGKPTDEETLTKLSAIRLRSKRAGSKSKYIGVYWDKTSKLWLVRLRLGGKYKWVGCFKDELEAAEASDRAAIKFFGPQTKLNFPNGQ